MNLAFRHVIYYNGRLFDAVKHLELALQLEELDSISETVVCISVLRVFALQQVPVAQHAALRVVSILLHRLRLM